MEPKQRKDFGEDSLWGGVVGLDAKAGIETGSPLINANLKTDICVECGEDEDDSFISENDSFISENDDDSGSGDSSYVPGTESEPESASGTEHGSNSGSEDGEDSSGGEGDDLTVEAEQVYLPLSKLVNVGALGAGMAHGGHPIEQFLTGNAQALEKKVEVLEAKVAKLTLLCGGCGYYVDQTDCCPPQVCCGCERSFCGRHSRMECWRAERTFWEDDVPEYGYHYDIEDTIAWLEHKYPDGVCYNCATAYLDEKYEDEAEYYPAKIQALVRGFLARRRARRRASGLGN